MGRWRRRWAASRARTAILYCHERNKCLFILWLRPDVMLPSRSRSVLPSACDSSRYMCSTMKPSLPGGSGVAPRTGRLHKKQSQQAKERGFFAYYCTCPLNSNKEFSCRGLEYTEAGGQTAGVALNQCGKNRRFHSMEFKKKKGIMMFVKELRCRLHPFCLEDFHRCPRRITINIYRTVREYIVFQIKTIR